MFLPATVLINRERIFLPTAVLINIGRIFFPATVLISRERMFLPAAVLIVGECTVCLHVVVQQRTDLRVAIVVMRLQ